MHETTQNLKTLSVPDKRLASAILPRNVLVTAGIGRATAQGL
jgi:hypothetical protein